METRRQTDSQVLKSRAQMLIDRIAVGCEHNNLGSATVAIYDTAWVAMVKKTGRWLFPECFQYLLEAQSSDGGWPGSSPEDEILNTLAALLALLEHSRWPDPGVNGTTPDLNIRIRDANAYIKVKLGMWDHQTTDQVGFEILVPALLSLLENHDVHFTFPAKQMLDILSRSKLQKFDEELFDKFPGTYLHSIEGLSGRIDYDRLSMHMVFGSLMASPASTAAYLIHCSVWHDEAEQYLRNTIVQGMGKRNGGVPSVWPMPVFESTWVGRAGLNE